MFRDARIGFRGKLSRRLRGRLPNRVHDYESVIGRRRKTLPFLHALTEGKGAHMVETLLPYRTPVVGPGGREFEARACAGDKPDGTWEGWIEFVPLDGGEPVRSPCETTQGNRNAAEYWATGLTPVYLEGALTRALAAPIDVVPIENPPPLFRGPAQTSRGT